MQNPIFLQILVANFFEYCNKANGKLLGEQDAHPAILGLLYVQ